MVGKILLLIFGQFACATAAIMSKDSEEHVTLLVVYRQLLAALFLAPLLLQAWQTPHSQNHGGRLHLAQSLVGRWLHRRFDFPANESHYR